MYFENSGLKKTWLHKRRKSPIPKYSWTGNVANGSKHCFNRNDSTFTIFIDHCEGNWVGKGLTCKAWRLFVKTLTAGDKYSLPSRDNLMQQIQMHLSQKQKLVLYFFAHFWNLQKILNIFKKRSPSNPLHFRNYGLWKTLLDKCLKSPVSGALITGNVVNEPKHCVNLNDSTFTICIDHFQDDWVAKGLS